MKREIIECAKARFKERGYAEYYDLGPGLRDGWLVFDKLELQFTSGHFNYVYTSQRYIFICKLKDL